MTTETFDLPRITLQITRYAYTTTLSNSSSNACELCTLARTPCTSVSLGWRLDTSTSWRSVTSLGNSTDAEVEHWLLAPARGLADRGASVVAVGSLAEV